MRAYPTASLGGVTPSVLLCGASVADGFWGIPYQRAFVDVSVVNPFYNSYKGLTLLAVYRNRECAKRNMIQGFEKLNMGVILYLFYRPVVAWPQSATLYLNALHCLHLKS